MESKRINEHKTSEVYFYLFVATLSGFFSASWYPSFIIITGLELILFIFWLIIEHKEKQK